MIEFYHKLFCTQVPEKTKMEISRNLKNTKKTFPYLVLIVSIYTIHHKRLLIKSLDTTYLVKQ